MSWKHTLFRVPLNMVQSLENLSDTANVQRIHSHSQMRKRHEDDAGWAWVVGGGCYIKGNVRMHHYVQPPWWRLLCPCTVGLGCDKKGDAFKYYRYAAFVHSLWSYGRPISSFSQEVLQTPKTFPKLAKLSQLHIIKCTLCLQCWLVIIAFYPLVYISPHTQALK